MLTATPSSWEYVHAPLVAPWAVKHSFQNYIQVHTPPALRNQSRSAEGNHPAALPYDGVAIFDPPSVEAFQAAFEDPYYKNVIALDEPKFLSSRTDVPRTMGEPRPIIKDGKLLIESPVEIMDEWRKWEEKKGGVEKT